MRVFHWNMAPPSHIAHKFHKLMPEIFRLRRGRGLQGAYMACDKFADHLLKIAPETLRTSKPVPRAGDSLSNMATTEAPAAHRPRLETRNFQAKWRDDASPFSRLDPAQRKQAVALGHAPPD